MVNHHPLYYIGLPQWQHTHWYTEPRDKKHALENYARHFTSVEGNTTFYALPGTNTVEKWKETTPDHFRFCFKFPRKISHESGLQRINAPLLEFLTRIEPLQAKTGLLWLQLSHRFTPLQLPLLEHFIEQLPTGYRYGIEIRHMGFFDKGENERRFNQLLLKHRVNRVLFDTRTLFQHPANDPDTLDAIKKKPKVPLHVLATHENPLVRFISPQDPTLASEALNQWVSKTLQWIEEGKTPYLFFHTPGNQQAPELAREFSQRLHQQRASIDPITLWSQQPQQKQLF